MLIVIFVIGISLIFVSFWLDMTCHDILSMLIGIPGIILSFFSFVLSVLCLINIVSGIDVDKRLAMYEEQQTEIENQLSVVVESYKDYENVMFDRPDTSNPMILISTYPELKTDTLIQKQCDLYIANNKKICGLKEEMIRLQTSKYLLYFGQ